MRDMWHQLQSAAGAASVMALASVILAACGGGQDAPPVTPGPEIFSTSFERAGGWQTGTYPTGADETTSTLAMAEGRYQVDHRASDSASFVWGADEINAQDVIVEVTAEQLSTANDNLYGVLCRLSEDARGNATGYALLVSGDGHYGIAELRSNSLSFLLEWHQSDAIRQGPAVNTLRAVCVNDTLALYANGTFLGRVTDSMYSASGPVGLIAGANANAQVSIAFDDLTVYEAVWGE